MNAAPAARREQLSLIFVTNTVWRWIRLELDPERSITRATRTPSASTLPLLVARVFTNDPHDAFAADHLALVTDLLNAGSNFHGVLFVTIELAKRGDSDLGRPSKGVTI